MFLFVCRSELETSLTYENTLGAKLKESEMTDLQHDVNAYAIPANVRQVDTSSVVVD